MRIRLAMLVLFAALTHPTPAMAETAAALPMAPEAAAAWALVPGLGHILLNRPAQGAVIAGTVLLAPLAGYGAGMGLFGPSGLLSGGPQPLDGAPTTPFASTAYAGPGGAIVGVGVSFGTWIWSIFDAHRLASEAAAAVNHEPATVRTAPQPSCPY